MTACHLSIIIPCYNEAGNIAELYARLHAICAPYHGKGYEILLVNDGSANDTWQEIATLARKDPHIIAIDLSRNFGQQAALTAGLELCRGERIFILDADLQDPPELLPEMMKRMDEGYDVVFGQRTTRAGEGAIKKITAHVYYRALNALSERPIPVDTGEFRLINRRVADALKHMPESVRFLRGMVSWVGFSQCAVTYSRAPRHSGHTKFTPDKMITLAFDGITNFSNKLPRIVLYMGLLTAMVTAGLLLVLLIAALGGHASGWATTIAIIMAFQSLQWIFLGLMGEYLVRIYTESKRRPHYFIREIIQSRT